MMTDTRHESSLYLSIDISPQSFRRVSMPSKARGIGIDFLEQSSNSSKKDSYSVTFTSKQTHHPPGELTPKLCRNSRRTT
jgi:hypothetical protein